MEREAFNRAWRFLSYDRSAKWLAILASVGAGVLYVALLVVLGLYADLIVHRGYIASFRELSTVERERLQQQWGDVPEAQLEQRWREEVHQLLSERAGPAAAEAVDRGQDDVGVLSLVVRSRDRVYGRPVAWLARFNPWMWKNGSYGHPIASYLPGLLIAAIVLAFLRAVSLFLSSYMAARAVGEAATRLRRAVYHHTFRLGTLAVRALGPTEAVEVFTRHLEAVCDGLYTRLTVVFREPVKIVLLLALAFVVSFWLALAFLVFAVLVWLIGGQIAAHFRQEGRKARARAGQQLALIQESILLMRLAKVYMMELFNQSRVERQLARLGRANLRRYRGEATWQPALVFLCTLAASILLAVAGLLILLGQLGVPTVILLATTLVSLYGPVVSLLESRRFLRRGRESAVVLFQFLDRPGEVAQVVGAEFLPPLTRYLEFDSVTLKEPGTNRILLDGVNFRIQAGERVAIVGSDELEKHALVYLLPRFLDPTTGEIRIDDHNLRWVTLESLRAQTAQVLQHNLVFNDTVANNIGCGDPHYTLPQIIEAAKMAHAHQFIQKLPQGYETPIGDMGHPLRIGESFRIALARAILRDPALLIIEETYEPLDEETKALLDDTYTRALPRRTVIFLPHRISTIRNCDRVYLLHKGRIEAAGQHRELLASNELYRHLHYIEFNEIADQVEARAG
jgi:ATP-binding cassette subfamily B protein